MRSIAQFQKSVSLGFLLLVCSSGLMAQAVNPKINVELERGPLWLSHVKNGLIDMDITPHIAVWLSDQNGNYLDTVYVSLKNGEQDFWVGNRPHPLPVWQKARVKTALADGTSSASPAPKAPQALRWSRPWPKAGLGLEEGIVVMVEINIGFDYNSRWPEKTSSPWGQPSIIYSGILDRKGSIELTVQGRSEGTSGTWLRNIDGIDSALSLLKSLRAW